MSNSINTNGINFNNAQLMQMSKALNGASKTTDASIFNMVGRLDANANNQLDANETSLPNLMTLGKEALAKLATALKIPVGNTGSEAKTEDTIINDYFKPFADNVLEQSSGDTKTVPQMSKEVFDNTMNSIIAEKKAQGIEILSQEKVANSSKDGSHNDTVITFTDGTKLTVSNGVRDSGNTTANIISYSKDDSHEAELLDLKSANNSHENTFYILDDTNVQGSFENIEHSGGTSKELESFSVYSKVSTAEDGTRNVQGKTKHVTSHELE